MQKGNEGFLQALNTRDRGLFRAMLSFRSSDTFLRTSSKQCRILSIELTANAELVLFQDDIALCRAHSSGQGKAQSAGNGMPFPRAATPHWPFEWAPFGRADKRSSALLYSLELATASPSVVRLAADRFLARCIGQYHLERVLVTR